MLPTFTSASDAQIITLVAQAKRRLVVIAPALSAKAAQAIATRMDDLPGLSLSIIIDADPEVYRMGYGEVEALEIIRSAAAKASFRLREQPGVRIGVIVSDDDTLVYSPVSQNIEAGSTTNDKPNAVLLTGGVADILAEKAGVPVYEDAATAPEIGRNSLSMERVAKTQDDLKQNPPLPVDLTRKLNVFITRVQYVDFKAKGYQLSHRNAPLPKEFVGMASDDLRERVTGRIRTPLDGIGKLNIEIDAHGKTEKLSVDEKFLQKERLEIEKTLTQFMPKRGRVILRKDRASFDYQIERFEAIVGAYQQALATELEKKREQFSQSFVDEFLERWKEQPPARFTRRLEPPSEDQLRRDIEEQANVLFDKMVKLDGPDISVIYKDIAIEDLNDQDFMNALHDVMAKGGVSQKDLNRLFEKGEAAAGQNSFNFGKGDT
jgi:hypothetical protein